MFECLLVLIIAFFLDSLLGDPAYPLHLVRLMGFASTCIETMLRRLKLSGAIGGCLLVLTMLSLFLGSYWGTRLILHTTLPWLGYVIDIFVIFSCIAFRDLLDHAKPIAYALESNNLQTARSEVQKIVGRDTKNLDAHGAARAAVESVAENFVDGLFSPLFWYVSGGIFAYIAGFSTCMWAVCGVLAYRVINTLDSMVGYRNTRYLYFGRVSARLDDAMNFFPARLAVISLFVAAIICKLKAIKGLKIFWRDRLKHISPNSAHAESFAAGAMGISLGGPTIYPHAVVQKPRIGEGPFEVSPEHIRLCCRLILWAGWISVGFSLLVFTITTRITR